MYDAGLYDPQEEEDEVSACPVKIGLPIMDASSYFILAYPKIICLFFYYRGFMTLYKT